MGYYIQGPTFGKGEYLHEKYGAIEISAPPRTLADINVDVSLICIVDNGAFEAALVVFSDRELYEVTRPDGRLRSWMLMDKDTAFKLAGFDVRRAEVTQ